MPVNYSKQAVAMYKSRHFFNIILLKSQALYLPKFLTEQQIKFANLLISEEGRKTATQTLLKLDIQKTLARHAASKLCDNLKN